jgi:septal ring factor EnvC (AmiA/AmiB activator)
MENLRKNNQTEIVEIKRPFSQIRNTMEGHSSRPEQGKDRLSGLEDKIDVKEKTEKLLVKQLKSCEGNMQELGNSIKRPNLRIMGIEEEEVQTKGIHNVVNKIVTENFPHLKKDLPIQVQESSRIPKTLDQVEPLCGILSLKQVAQRTNIEGCKREKTNNF